jgi:thiamine phosphate synthase YjbQ (UPF0047 family)
MWYQKTFTLPPRSRGSYLITDTILKELPELKGYKVGILNLFIQHTSCALSLNENWDEDVRKDMSDALDRIAPEDESRDESLYRHSAEGKDDMPVSSLPIRILIFVALWTLNDVELWDVAVKRNPHMVVFWARKGDWEWHQLKYKY